MTKLSLAERRDRALGAGAPLFYREPLNIVRGDGVYLYDADGRQYVDLYNNVPCVGHANPRVVEAMQRQQATLNVHSRYLHEGIVEFAERLAGLHGDHLEAVVFSCSGTEANEVALRMARVATGRQGIICSDAAYHGNSTAVGALTHVGGRGETDAVAAFPFPQTMRPIEDSANPDVLRAAYLERVDAAIGRLEESGAGVAALLVCPIFANEGLPEVPPGFLAAAAERVRRAGGVIISDEVQAGYCRTGTWWGYTVAGFEPDIVVTGKPMGNGLPLAATTATRELVETFRRETRYFNTFASSPLQAAVGGAVLDVIESDGLADRVAQVGARMKETLSTYQNTIAAIGDVRGEGLFIGIDWVDPNDGHSPDPDGAIEVVNRLKDAGFLTSNAGAHRNVVKIRPPLVFENQHADAFLAAFDAVVSSLDG